MAEVLDGLGNVLNEQHIAILAQRLNASPDQIEQAIGSAVPLLIGGLARQTQEGTASNQIHTAFSSSMDSGLLEHLDDYLKQGGQNAAATPLGFSATDVLSQILSGKQDRVEKGVGKTSGLDSKQTGQLLTLLAPIVLAYLKRRQQQQQVPDKDVGSWLGKQSRDVEQAKGGSMIGRILDQDGDGDFDLMDVFSFATSRLFRRK